MTADLVQNVPKSGSIPPCHLSQAKANYSQDVPSTTLAFEGNKRSKRNPGAEHKIRSGRMNSEERVHSQDEADNRTSSPGNRILAVLTKRKDSEEDVEKSAHGQALPQAGDSCKPAFPEKSRKLRLQAPSGMDEAGGDADDEMEVVDDEGKKSSVDFGVQGSMAAPQLNQSQANQAQYNQPGTSVGGWENFLPQRILRILLVEDDDSTRHVVGALLRNCGYEVTPAASGAQAWEILQDKINHFDLVLTDVMLPSLFGISLLSKIMSQETCKQIPVVMMSSLDSVDIVFKCLSKGAVDFLVKPVRKNELKNLWQHVWRKCHSSSGSGSGSGSQTGQVAGLKNTNATTNNSGSDEHDSSSWNAGGGSDNGSGTQSIWTKRMEVESPRQPIERDVPRHSNGHMNAELQTNVNVLTKDRKRSSRDTMKPQAEFQAKAGDFAKGKDLEVAASRSGIRGYHVKKAANPKDSSRMTQRVLLPEDVEQNDAMDDEEAVDVGAAVLESAAGVRDLLGNIACQHTSKDNQNCRGDEENLDRGASNSPTTKDNASGSTLPMLELTLKRSHAADVGDRKVEVRPLLWQSGPSAFSRYSNVGSALQQSTHYLAGPLSLSGFPLQGGFVGHSSTPAIPIGLCVATPADRASPYKGSGDVSAPFPSHSHPPCASINKDSSPVVGGATGQEVHLAAKEEVISGAGMQTPVTVQSHTMLSFDGVGALGTSRHPVFYTSKPPWVASNLPDQEGYANQQFEDLDLSLQVHRQAFRHYSHHYHHHHVQHHYHHHLVHPNSESLEAPEDDQTVTNPGTGAPQCGSSNMIGTVPGNLVQSGSSNGYGMTGNGSVNGSASGSYNGSNNHNGTSNCQSGIVVAAGGNGDGGNNHGNSGSGNGNGISSVNCGNGGGIVMGPERNCFTRREAALNKFRQKRKERCFEKKVRYQSRKRLAEQRPRVRGQFVRQAATVSGISDQSHGNNEYPPADRDREAANAEP